MSHGGKKIRDCNFRVQNTRARKQEKSGRRMPRLSEAKKDVVSCEKRRGTANRFRSVGVRMGQPVRLKA